jgi:hypothetical protein
MSKIQTFERENVKQLQRELQVALTALANEHGIKIQVGRATYNNSRVTVKVELVTKDETGTAQTAERDLFIYRVKYQGQGLQASDLDRTFTWSGEEYRITGWAKRSMKAPIEVVRLRDNKNYRMPIRLVTASLGIPLNKEVTNFNELLASGDGLLRKHLI